MTSALIIFLAGLAFMGWAFAFLGFKSTRDLFKEWSDCNESWYRFCQDQSKEWRVWIDQNCAILPEKKRTNTRKDIN
jgi:hypothetical protein